MKRLEREMAAASENLEFEKAARLRDDLGCAPAGAGEAGRRPRRRHGRRRRRLRPGRAGGRRPGLPRPRRAGPRAARLDRRQGRGGHHRRAGRAVPAPGLRRRGRADRRGRGGGGRAPRGARPRAAGRRRRLHRAARGAARRQGVAPGAPARRQAQPDGDRRAQRQGGVRPPPGAACQRPHRSLPRPRRAPGGAGAARRPPADRVHRHLARPGDERRGQHGGLRGRAGEEVRLPPVLRRPRHRRHRGDGRGRAAPVRAAPQGGGRPAERAGHRGRGRPAAPVRLPAQPARRRRWRAAGRGREPVAGRARDRRHRRLRAGQAHGGGVAAGGQRPGDPAAHLRGAVPAPARAGRGPPVRHHLPPAEALDEHAGVPPGRRPRSRGHAAKGADEGIRLAEAAPCRLDRRAHGGSRHRPADGGSRPGRDRGTRRLQPGATGGDARPGVHDRPQGPAERGQPQDGAGATAEVGRVAS